MRKIYKTKGVLRLLFSVITAGFMTTASAQLSGSYTIDSATATGGSNYKSWSDFRNDIVTNGVSGPVSVKVITDVVETGQINFPAITGTSSTNTVTIDGNGKVLLADVADAVLLLSGADYFTFDKLTVRNTTTSQYATGLRIHNASDYNTFKNGIIELSGLTTATTSGGAFVSFSSSATSPTSTSSTNPATGTVIDNNTMRTTNVNSPGPSYAITLLGSSSSYSGTAQNNTISNNIIQNFYYMAIYMYYTNGDQVTKNDISRANATSYNCYSNLYGIYSYYSYATSRPTKLDGNTLHDWPYQGGTVSSAPGYVYSFYLQYNYGNSSYRFSMSNNTLKNIMCSGYMYLASNSYNYYFDMIGNMADNNDVPVGTSSSYYFYGFYNQYTYNSFRFNSNTVQNCNGGYYWYGIYNGYPQSPNGVTEINDNVIQNNGGSYYYTYHIYNYYAQYANSTYPIDIKRNLVKNNSSNYYYMYCINSYYYGTINITDNVIDGNYTTDYYYLYALSAQYYGYYNILRNTIKNNKNAGSYGYIYGIYDFYNYTTNCSSNLIVDNKGYYGMYGIYTYNYNNVAGTYHWYNQNTIINDGNQSSYGSPYFYAFMMQLYQDNNVQIMGNIVDLKNDYNYVTYAYSNTGFAGWIWDRNSYSVTNVSSQYWYNGSTSYTTFAQWKNAATPAGPNETDMSAVGHNFASNYASNRFLNQNNIQTQSVNPKDLYNANRNPAKSDRGAVEGFLDIAQTANTFAPNSPMCAGGYITPTITFKNNFLEDVTGFVVACSDNGVLKATAKMTNIIAVNGTNTVTFAPLQFSKSGNHVVKFFLLDADDLPANDTMTFSFNVLKAPGGATLTQNTSLSSTAAQFVTTGKPDVTFPDEKLVYDLSNPTSLPYSNSDYQGQGGGNKWVASVSALTVNGFPASTVVSRTFSSGLKVTVDAPKAWEDSTIEVSIKVVDLVTNCDTIYKRKVFIAPKAVPAVKLPSVLCEQSELYFESMSTVSSGSIDYDWDFGDGTQHSNEASPVHKYASSGSYTVVLKTTTNPYPFTTSKSFVVNVTEIPVAKILNTNACFGTPVKLSNGTVYGGSGSISYNWNYGDNSAANNTTSSAPISKSYAAPGGYEVTLIATAAGCSSTFSKVVYQFAKPVASYTKVAGSCLNSEFTFKNNSTIALGQLGSLWDFDDAGNKATLDNPTYTFTTAGVKAVKLKVVSEFGCTDSMTIPTTVKQIPTTSFSFPFACSRTATPFTNTTSLNGEVLQGYLWNFGDGFTSTATSPIKSWTSIGPRVVKLTTTLQNGCSTSESKTITVGVQPNVNFQAEDRCAGSEVPFTNNTTFSQGTIIYTWDFGDGNTSNTAVPVHVYGSTVSQTYTVKLKAQIVNGCADSMSKTVTIQPLPTTCSFDINGKLSAAKTSPLNFVPTGGTPAGITYTWITGDGNSLTSSGAGTQYTYSAPGKYCVTMTARNIAGCECSTTKCVSLTTDITSAESMNNAVSVYPNPNDGIFNVALAAEISTDMTVNVYNVLGELVKTVVVNGTTASIDMTDFASGVYTVKVMADNQVATKKITITK